MTEVEFNLVHDLAAIRIAQRVLLSLPYPQIKEELRTIERELWEKVKDVTPDW